MAELSGLDGSAAGVHQVLAGGLGEHRRRVAREAELEAADRQRFQQLRSGRKLMPAHFGLREPLFQHALLLEDDQVDRRLLVADAQ